MRLYCFKIFFICFSVLLSNTDHLLFSRITITPNNAELISIYNPTDQTIELSDYYITDSNLYYNISSGQNFWSGSPLGFIARFPDQYSIEPGDYLTIGLHNGFFDYYGYAPDLTMGDMRDAIDGESTIGLIPNLNNDNEILMLFKWSGDSDDPVQDVDYFVWGNAISQGVDKTEIAGYVPDTPVLEQNPIDNNQDNYTYTRIALNSEGDEILSGGNGITGHDETSENLSITWQSVLSPEGGCMDANAPNYNIDAAFDNNTCVDYTIKQIYNQYESNICNNDLSDEDIFISTMGLIIDYGDFTSSNGPRVITIEDPDGYQLDVTIWDWDPTLADNGYHPDISYMIDPYSPTQYYVLVYGLLGSYNCNFQLDASNVGYDDPINGTITYYDQINTSGDYQSDDSIVKASIDAAPYPFVPSSGERIDFNYSFPDGARVIIRVFDLSGRFITSLVDNYFGNSGTVYMEEDGSADWDGRDHLGQIVSPGTYLIHIEAMNFQTGVTTSDVAPIVVGVSP